VLLPARASAAHSSDSDGLGSGLNAAGAAQVVGQGAAQFEAAAHVAVAVCAHRRLAQGTASTSQPLRDRKGRDIRCARPKVESRCRRLAATLDGLGDGSEIGDFGAGSVTGNQVALGDKLVVGSSHCAPGQAEVLCKYPRRRQHGAGGQPAALDRGAQTLL